MGPLADDLPGQYLSPTSYAWSEAVLPSFVACSKHHIAGTYSVCHNSSKTPGSVDLVRPNFTFLSITHSSQHTGGAGFLKSLNQGLCTWSSSPRPCPLIPCPYWNRALERPGPCNAATYWHSVFLSTHIASLQCLAPALQLAVVLFHHHQDSWFCLLFKEQSHSSFSFIPKSQRFNLLFDLGQGQ